MIRLHADNLEKRFGRKTVFSNLSIDSENSVLGIAGANGAGKSTLLKCLAGLLKPSSGSLNWFQNNSKIKKTDLKNHLGFAAPYVQLYEELTVKENLEFIQNVRAMNPTSSLEHFLKPFGAGHLVKMHVGELSTGQQQRIKLAAAVLHDPEILLLDEPGSNLDTAGKNLVEEIVETFSGKNRMVIIASNQNDELSLCKEIIELSKS